MSRDPSLESSIRTILREPGALTTPRSTELEQLLGLNPGGLVARATPPRIRGPEEQRRRTHFERNQRRQSARVKLQALAEWGGHVGLLQGDQCQQKTGLPADEFWRQYGLRAAEKLPRVLP